MFNFIICDDNEYVRKMNASTISKIVMKYDFNYSIKEFEKYDTKLKNIINSPSDLKIYILDLELPNKSGIDIVREIRKVDWDSIIIILTSHSELELSVLKQKLLILDFISKFDNYEQRLDEAINMVVNNITTKKMISFKSNKELHYIKLDDIIYVYKDNYTQKTILVTKENEFPIRDSLTNIISKLDSRFVQSHRACYVNIEKIESIDFKNNILSFGEELTTDLLSRTYKNNFRRILK